VNAAHSNNPTRPAFTLAFTLVEMLVSMAVLAIIMLFVARMTDSTAISTNLSGKHLDADSQARLVFDRMAVDFARMPRRTDVDYIFAKQWGLSTTSGSSDKMFFYSEAPAYYDATLFTGTTQTPFKSSVALIGYACAGTSGTTTSLPAYSLLRLSKGLTWDATLGAGTSGSSTPPGGMLFLTSTAQGSIPLAASSMAGNPNLAGDIGSPPGYTPDQTNTTATNPYDYQEFDDVLSNEVLRMEFCFEVKDLTNATQPGTAYSNYPVAYYQANAANTRTLFSGAPTSPFATGTHHVGDRYYDYQNNRAYVCTSGTSSTTLDWTPNGLADVRAIVVAIAILDNTSRKLAPTQLGNIASALADPTEDANATTGLQAKPPHLMAELWQNTINSSSFRSLGIPPAAASQVRVYQRYFYLNNQ
jgi:prepilin-type N-terminal cleavage/methylation domain-containing protein